MPLSSPTCSGTPAATPANSDTRVGPSANQALDTKELNRKIIDLAWPSVATNITTPLLSLVDVAIVGHLGSAVFIAAIAVGGSMFNLLYWLFGFLRMGTSGFTAQACGTGDAAECVRSLARSLATAVLASVFILALSHPIADVVIRFMDADAETAMYARRYFLIAVWGAPAVMTTYVLAGWFLGMQSSRPSMWMALSANVFNICLSLTLVWGLGMGIEGVATGTACAQWLSALVGVGILVFKLRRMKFAGWRTGLWNMKRLAEIFAVNRDIFLRTICLIAVTLWFTHAGALQGPLVLAANALLMQLFFLFSYFMDGVAFSAEALGGRFVGRNDMASLHQLVRSLMRFGVVLGIISALLYFFFGDLFLGMLTDDAKVIATADQYRYWAVAVPIVGFSSFLWDGICIGTTRTRIMLLSMAAAMVSFFSIYFLLHPVIGNDGLWLAFIVYLGLRGALLALMFPHALPAYRLRR